ncbi:hypothetical protein [Candidatus Galacturonibacter soehngenii]|uniref:Uncharacterized protein n=1 Tax=Candidatus Galacturonatibacter soehngenii TaxID=2307010 RepID=A0A7V7QK03_9FIRM|nr:hypothetical protein [Candidatus Galacturonibacter soehngenii]KAB1438072.1 hypothetical protein F7O84_10965 [Candidatus Galacturonibacter soehngenii]
MIYGIVSEKDDKTSLAYLKSKKVADVNIIHVSRLDVLSSRFVAGDIIYVISVDRFPSVSRFVAFAEAVLHAGVSLRILEQSYLEVGNGKHFRPAVAEHLNTLVCLERCCAQRLFSAFPFNVAGKDYAADCIADITVGILAKTYLSDGILHRGG